jgi:hypothetical protein
MLSHLRICGNRSSQTRSFLRRRRGKRTVIVASPSLPHTNDTLHLRTASHRPRNALIILKVEGISVYTPSEHETEPKTAPQHVPLPTEAISCSEFLPFPQSNISNPISNILEAPKNVCPSIESDVDDRAGGVDGGEGRDASVRISALAKIKIDIPFRRLLLNSTFSYRVLRPTISGCDGS